MRSVGKIAALSTVLVAAGTVWIGTSAAAHHRHSHKAIVAVPLPPPNSTQISEITVKVTAPRGKKVGPLTVTTANNPQLGNEAIVYIAQAPKKRRASETIRVFALINRFGTARGRTAKPAQEAGQVDVALYDEVGFVDDVQVQELSDCGMLKQFDGLFESGHYRVTSGDYTYDLSTGRTESEQPTPPERVLDDIVEARGVSLKCPGPSEGDDPGPK